MKKIMLLLWAILLTSGQVFAEGQGRVDWVMYLVTSPRHYRSITSSNLGIETHKFPLYLGYIYSEDSKSIKWHSALKVAGEAMKSWSTAYTTHVLPKQFPIMHADGMYWVLSDEYFFDAAVSLIWHTAGMFPIRYERNAIIDKNWIPEFKDKYCYSKMQADNNEMSDFPSRIPRPLNWDQDAYNERMKK